jgi:hypothetical protein
MKHASTLHVVPSPKRKKDTRVGLFNSDFVYVRSEHTDIRVRFAAVKAELAKGKRT